MKSGRVVYHNGVFVDEKDAKVSIFDSALMFGDMVFEMTRSFNQEQFKLREHLERLYNGLHILQIPIKQTIEEFILMLPSISLQYEGYIRLLSFSRKAGEY